MEIPNITPSRRLSRDECLAIITAPLSRQYGFRHLWIGYTGCGKSFANLELIKASEGSHKYLVITDQKNRDCTYLEIPGTVEVPIVDAVDSVEPDNRNHFMCVVRGPRLTSNKDDLIDFDALGGKVWELSREDKGVLLGIDELSDACEGERTWIRGDSRKSTMRLLYTQGRTNRVSVAACTQHVQEVPRSAIANSDTIAIFCQDRKELGYYAQNKFLDDRELDIVTNLPEYEFLLLKRGMESRVCRF